MHPFAEAYAVSHGETVLIQLVSDAARACLPILKKLGCPLPDSLGVFSVPVDQAEVVFTALEETGLALRVLG